VSGSRLYAGGQFTAIGASAVSRLARFVETAVPPTATSGAASAITDTSASLAGSVNPDGAATTYVFEYGTSSSFGAISTPAAAGSGSADVPVTAVLSGLSPDTTYYYRLVASSAAGTTFGAVRALRTTGGTPQPRVVTLAASSTTNTTTTLSGQVNPSGQPTAFTFEYGPTTSFGSISTVVQLDDATVPEPVSASLTGLTPDTTYYYRLVATNAAGTAAGSDMRFTTGPGGAPIVMTGAASAIAATGATLAGTVDAHGLQTSFTFAYGTSVANLSSITAVDSAEPIDGPQPITLPAAGLSPGTTYFFRLVATNAAGTSFGTVRSFTTAAGT
jgi:phosphodiesterase/alkaline phosphatase D-like protein